MNENFSKFFYTGFWHANFSVNNGNAKGSDIVSLIKKIQDDVMDKYGVLLILEQIIID